jgi:hypothetical protein
MRRTAQDLGERISERTAWRRSITTPWDVSRGVSFPRVPKGDRSTHKDLTILLDPERFGSSTRSVAEGFCGRRHRHEALLRPGAPDAGVPGPGAGGR